MSISTSTLTQTQTPTPNPLPTRKEILTSLRTNGYILIPSLIPPSSALFAALQSASQQLTARARSGSWAFVRTLPKQFPPWDASDAMTHGIWGVQHLLHPALPATEREVFAEAYFDERILGVVKAILGLGDNNSSRDDDDDGDGQLVMELFNLLVRPGTAEKGEAFELRWHRDDVGPELVGAAEEQALGLQAQNPASPQMQAYTHTQFNLSLSAEEDSSLVVVPGSHMRARTAEEVQCMTADPYHPDMPGQITVRLRAGDVVFYDNNILHRGVYSGDKERWTLHGSYSRKGAAKERARNVLQHGVGDWISKCGFEGMDQKIRTRADVMKAGLVQMGREGGWSGEYSLQG